MSGEGKMNFTEFLALARDLDDGLKREKANKDSQKGWSGAGGVLRSNDWSSTEETT